MSPETVSLFRLRLDALVPYADPADSVMRINARQDIILVSASQSLFHLLLESLERQQSREPLRGFAPGRQERGVWP